MALAMSDRTSQASVRIQDRLRIVAILEQDQQAQTIVPAPELAQRVRLLPDVERVRIVPREEVRAVFVRQVTQPGGPLPSLRLFQEALEIRVASVDAMRRVASAVRTQPGVERVTYLDELVSRINGFSSWLERGSLYAALLLVLVALVVIALVVRSSIYAEQRALETMRHVGGSLTPISAPIIVHLVVVGLVAATAACALGAMIDPRLDGILTVAGRELPEWLQTGRAFAPMALWPAFAGAVVAGISIVAAVTVAQYARLSGRPA
ncbi:FtsX-like permease family protein [Conexibacter sp. W3-3-2]|uniref:FtsX-like permease family protein n=1 Tax=Conexibacter sp. W3-3-2 TaxID=2675227 RepID=UPI0012B810A3|nr:FtsX-like permease family protein [Conexibacter sp. W3-3-2]MTD47258.1 FtsX-like permease family protein [Conexibacter sp. W3-3-2]